MYKCHASSKVAARSGLFFALAALLVVPAPLAKAQKAVFSGVDRIVAVGDVHGDLAAFMEVLRAAKVVDSSGKWIGGKTNLVQIGDLPDRGPDTRKVIELLQNLEKQAKKAGGAIHVLIGNHDAMNMYGDLRYTTAAEFAEFKSDKSAELRDAFYQQLLEQKKPADPAAFKAKFDKETPLGWVEHRQAWEPKGPIGRWTASHPAVLKINDTLFVHAGLSPRMAALTIEEINKSVRTELLEPAKLQGGLAMAEDGPLWWRGIAQGPEEPMSAHVDTLLKNFGVARIVIGHTPTKAAIKPRFGGRVVDIDVGLSQSYSGPKDCLIIEGSQVSTLLGMR